MERMEKIGRCVIIGASPDTNIDFIRNAVQAEDYVICADGGADFARAAGIRVDLAVGDFDSGAIPADAPVEQYPPEKDYTDLELAVKRGVESGFRRFLILGGTGGRLVHTIMNLMLLFRCARHGIEVMLEDSELLAYVLTGAEASSRIPPGVTYSVFSVGGDSIVSEVGAKYPLDHHILPGFDSTGVSGVSNFSQDGAEVILHRGNLLIVIEKHV